MFARWYKTIREKTARAGRKLNGIGDPARLSVIIMAVVLVAGAFLLKSVVAAPAFSAQQGDPLRTGDDTGGKIAITCNVAWGEEYLPEMLEILKEKNVRITFMILGEWAETHQEELKAIADAGHEIGNHGYYHVNQSGLSAEGVKEDITKSADLIESITGTRPVIFEPPSGDYDEESLSAARELGQTVILWSIDTIDWRRDGTDAILKRVFRDPKAGDIILMHPTKYTVEALPEIIDGLIERGLTPCAAGDILP